MPSRSVLVFVCGSEELTTVLMGSNISDLGLSIHVVCKVVSTGLLMNSSRVTLQRVEAHIDVIPALSTFDFPYVFGSWRGVKLQCVWKLTST